MGVAVKATPDDVLVAFHECLESFTELDRVVEGLNVTDHVGKPVGSFDFFESALEPSEVKSGIIFDSR